MSNKIPSFLLDNTARPALSSGGSGKLKTSFIDKGLKRLSSAIKSSYIQWELASRDGFFQRLDARVKTLCGLLFIIIISLKHDLMSQAVIAFLVLLLSALSRLDLYDFYRRILLFAFLFGFLVTAPSALNIVSPGKVIFPLITLSGPHELLIYRIPHQIGITREGLYSVAMLTSRVMNSLSITMLVLYTTSFQEISKALKVLRVPDIFLMILTISYKYIFVFARTVEDMHLARKSRMTGSISPEEGRKWIAGSLAFTFRKSQLKCEDIFKAMVGRGLTDEIRLPGFSKMRTTDWAAALAGLSAGILIFIWN